MKILNVESSEVKHEFASDGTVRHCVYVNVIVEGRPKIKESNVPYSAVRSEFPEDWEHLEIIFKHRTPSCESEAMYTFKTTEYYFVVFFD